jgi:hypothetical protein
MANNNPYPDLDDKILKLFSEDVKIKSTDIVEAFPHSESAIRAHLRNLCKQGKVKRTHYLRDMRAAYYQRGACYEA